MNDWLRSLPKGCLPGALALLALFGIAVSLFFLVIDDSPSPPPPPDAPSSGPPAAGCEDATAAFRASGGTDLVQRVCWEPTGSLRAQASPSADVEPGSPPMRAVCSALSAFVTGSGRAWNGFTVYSTHRFTPGRPMLTSSQPGVCGRP